MLSMFHTNFMIDKKQILFKKTVMFYTFRTIREKVGCYQGWRELLVQSKHPDILKIRESLNFQTKKTKRMVEVTIFSHLADCRVAYSEYLKVKKTMDKRCLKKAERQGIK